MPEKEIINRREFIRRMGKISLAVGSGVATGLVLQPISIELNQEVEKITNKPTNNASLEDATNQVCGNKNGQDDTSCLKTYYTSEEFEVNAVGTAPFFEETISRYLPSMFMGHTEKEKKSTLLSRRELIVGGLTSLLFGYLHNITSKGFDTNNIPAAQILGGGAFWYLQRKFGLGSNTIAHMVFNQSAINSIKNN